MTQKNTSTSISELQDAFLAHSDAGRKAWMQSYMRNQFDFFGIPAPARRGVQKIWFRKYMTHVSTDVVVDVIRELFTLRQREFQYTAIDLLSKKSHILPDERMREILETCITTKPWWDTVDILATQIAGKWLYEHEELKKEVSTAWLNSDHIWLMRTALIFQLKYKTKTDFELLRQCILTTAGHKNFFIQKAIGWALREYSKTYPNRVHTFVTQHQAGLSNLAKREALRWIDRKK